MEGGIFLYRAGLHGIAVFEGEHRFVLGAVIFEHTVDVPHSRHSVNEKQEQQNANDAVHQVENYLLPEHRIQLLQRARSQQRQELVHKDEETD